MQLKATKLAALFSRIHFALAFAALAPFVGLAAGSLPAGYTQLEYIDSGTFERGQGPALRIFGFHLDTANRVATKVRFNKIVSVAGQLIAGANAHTIFSDRDSEGANTFTVFAYGDQLRYDRNTIGTPSGDTLVSDKDYVLVADGDTLTATPDGENSFTVSNSTDFSTSPTADLLLYDHNDDSQQATDSSVPLTSEESSMAQMRMYYFRVYADSDKTSLRLDLIPVKNDCDEVGMYDRVSGQFYKSVTSVPFVAGPSEATFLQSLASDPRRVDLEDADADPYATGGDIVLKDDDEYIHIFTTVGTQQFAVKQNCTATALLVGGGGGGGANDGGGGGAGGMVEVPSMGLKSYVGQDIEVTVGAGAAKVTGNTKGNNGGESSFGNMAVAYGGGGGGCWGSRNGLGGDNLGSGGGATGNDGNGTAGTPGESTSGQGNNGGKGFVKGKGSAGGGGGAGDVGDDASQDTIGGNGGDGRVCSILGGDFTEQYFAGGGGGGSVGSDTDHSSGGAGGGGDGASSKSIEAKNGVDGLGGGGGGGSSDYYRQKFGCEIDDGGAGGSGIVIIRVSAPIVEPVARPTQEWTSEPYADANFKPVFEAREAYEISYSADEWIAAGNYTVTFTLNDGYEWATGDDKTSPEVLAYTITANGSYHVMRVDGPEISVKQQWLVSLAGAGKSANDYQSALFETNANGVVAWQAYVLGYEADKVKTAAIVEETVQNAYPDTVTIQLKDMPPPRPDTGFTVKYSLYASPSTQVLLSGGGSVVTNLAGKAFERCDESTFEAPLRDLNDDNPVNYYRIKVHFIFGGGGDAGEVIYQVSGAVTADTEGWTIGGEVYSPKIDISSADAKYIQLKFKATEPCKMSRSFLYFYKTQDQSSEDASLGDGIYSGGEQEYWHTYRVPEDANWIDLGFFNTSGHTGGAAPVTLADVEIAAVSEAQAVAGAKAVSAQFDRTLLDKVIADDLAPASDPAWGRGLPGMKAALKGGASPYKVLVLTCSTLVHVQWEGLLAEQVRDRFPGRTSTSTSLRSPTMTRRVG